MAKRKYIIIVIILAICISIIGLIVFKGINKNNEDSKNTQKVNSKIEEKQEVSIENLKKKIAENGLEITDETTKIGTLIGANEVGYGYEINGDYIEVYEYDENSSEELTKQNIKSAKEKNIITMPAFNNAELTAMYNKGLMLVGYEEHPNKEKIIEIFNNL